MPAPILFLIFNRPDLTAKVFEKIRSHRPERLYIAADGHRSTRDGEENLCKLTREATENVDWPCEVHRLYRKSNLGCKMAVSSAIDWLFQHEEEGIVLEDDCLPDPTFFVYCDELLALHRNNPRIGMISGTNFHNSAWKEDQQTSYYYTLHPHIWGWATWRRVWNDYDVNLSKWDGKGRNYLNQFSNPLVRMQYREWFDSIRIHQNDTWDFQLLFLMISRNYLGIMPRYNLIENIGYDERATHTIETEAKLPESHPMPFTLIHPELISANKAADRVLEQEFFKPFFNMTWPHLLKKRLKAKIRRLKSARMD